MWPFSAREKYIEEKLLQESKAAFADKTATEQLRRLGTGEFNHGDFDKLPLVEDQIKQNTLQKLVMYMRCYFVGHTSTVVPGLHIISPDIPELPEHIQTVLLLTKLKEPQNTPAFLANQVKCKHCGIIGIIPRAVIAVPPRDLTPTVQELPEEVKAMMDAEDKKRGS